MISERRDGLPLVETRGYLGDGNPGEVVRSASLDRGWDETAKYDKGAAVDAQANADAIVR